MRFVSLGVRLRALGGDVVGGALVVSQTNRGQGESGGLRERERGRDGGERVAGFANAEFFGEGFGFLAHVFQSEHSRVRRGRVDGNRHARAGHTVQSGTGVELDRRVGAAVGGRRDSDGAPRHRREFVQESPEWLSMGPEIGITN